MLVLLVFFWMQYAWGICPPEDDIRLLAAGSGVEFSVEIYIIVTAIIEKIGTGK